ncbi:hypothetical protein DPMN_037376 [Dreissena polymorpha]|uniref:Uncharacterized protein n=1 Tax=Dreissena polymorpha TaxID=45954 RepID=A0A9D4MDE8_DREPO|nr:hypothetical protein DPMN_037376 [Dreissena polymorpha]
MLKQNFGCAWSMYVGHPRVGNGAMNKVNRCKNKEVNFQGSSANSTDGLTYSGDNQIIPRSNLEGVRSKLKIFQGSSAKSVGGDSVQDGQTDGGENQNIPTLLNAWG